MIMSWKAGRVDFEPNIPPKERTIPIPSEQLLLNWSSRKIELEDVQETLPSEQAVFPNQSVFRLSLQKNGDSKMVSGDQWNVLALSNGMRNISEIAKILNWDESKVSRVIYQLVKTGLMEQGDEQKPVKKKLVRESLFSVIENELKKVMGAVSPFVIDDKLGELGERKESFPQERFLFFIEALGDEIPNDLKRREFKKSVMESLSLEK
jgi:DNA-binding MarR family transcriptional regulator